MTTRRLLIGILVMFVISFCCWVRPGAKQVHAHPTGTAHAVTTDEECEGNFDDQEHRFRTGQCRHWKQVVLGTR